MRVVQNLPATSRWRRQPSHTFQLRHAPFAVQPFMLAPVLPGETLKGALIQSRAITDGIRNQLVGWWLEHHLYYVKHRDMSMSAELQSMVLQPGFDMSGTFTEHPVVQHYHAGEGIDWVSECLRAVVTHYFRDDGEEYRAGGFIDGLPVAKLNARSWTDSIATEAMMPDGQPVPSGATAGQVDLILQQWQLLREMKLTTATYEEFLASYGVRSNLREEENKPELIRYSRDWTYPSNTVDGATSQVASACSWSIAERADKDRYFSEPGFVFGVTVARPKVYLGRQAGAASSMLTDALAWLPAVMRDDPATSLRKFEAGKGPVKGVTTEYYVDARDLFMYGDQFVNFDASAAAADAAAVALPAIPSTTMVNAKYPDGEMVDRLFRAPTGGRVRQDGVCTLTIMSSVKDHTAPTAVVR